MLALRTPLLQPPNLLWQAGGQATLMDTLLSPVSSGADLTPSSMSPQNHTWAFNLEGFTWKGEARRELRGRLCGG